MRRAARTDGNFKAIAEAFERMGCMCHRSNGDWDLTVQLPGDPWSILVEVKNPDSARGKREIKSGGNKRQQGMKMRRVMVTNMDEVAATVALLRKRHAVMYRETLAD